MQNARGDFANYYTSSKILLDGKKIETAYSDFTWFQIEMDKAGIKNQIGSFIPFPPSTAIVFLPLANFDPLSAKRIWGFINILLLAFTIVALSKFFQINWLVSAIIFLSTGYGLINNFILGQLYILVISTFAGGLWAYKSKHFFLAGFLIGLFIPIKYIGILFVVYFIWKRKWRAVTGASSSILLVTLITLFFTGIEPYHVFISDILPRHLAGEIQNPFSLLFQSWNSMFKRMFVFNETLNPNPIIHAPFIASILKAAVFWIISSAIVLSFYAAKLKKKEHQALFEIALIPLFVLLTAPASATYHFILLTITVMAFVKILLDHRQINQALILAILFLLLNLPHYPKLAFLADGLTTPLAYSRLWLLFLFAILSAFFLKPLLSFKKIKYPRFVGLFIFIMIVISATQSVKGSDKQTSKQIEINDPEFKRNLGLILKTPDIGSKEIVFSYCELFNERFTIYTIDGKSWASDKGQNYYYPSLAYDDSSLLVQTVDNGEDAILFIVNQNEPVFLTSGSRPVWLAGNVTFLFQKDNQIFLGTILQKKLLHTERILNFESGSLLYDFNASQTENKLIYCIKNAQKDLSYKIYEYSLETGYSALLLESRYKFERPVYSPNNKIILFSWRKNNNQDIYAFILETKESIRLTTDSSKNKSPVWDKINNRIVFTSDRNRGIEMSTLYSIPIPQNLILQK